MRNRCQEAARRRRKKWGGARGEGGEREGEKIDRARDVGIPGKGDGETEGKRARSATTWIAAREGGTKEREKENRVRGTQLPLVLYSSSASEGRGARAPQPLLSRITSNPG